MKKKAQIPISQRALKARVNRALKAKGLAMRAVRGKAINEGWGKYIVIDVRKNFVAFDVIGLGELAGKLGVLKAWECYTEE